MKSYSQLKKLITIIMLFVLNSEEIMIFFYRTMITYRPPADVPPNLFYSRVFYNYRRLEIQSRKSHSVYIGVTCKQRVTSTAAVTVYIYR